MNLRFFLIDEDKLFADEMEFLLTALSQLPDEVLEFKGTNPDDNDSERPLISNTNLKHGGDLSINIGRNITAGVVITKIIPPKGSSNVFLDLEELTLSFTYLDSNYIIEFGCYEDSEE